MALELAIIGVVVGIVLGLRYKVLVLVPAVLFAMISAIAVGVGRADSFWSIVLTTVALVIAVQLGYLAGIVIQAAIAANSPTAEGRRQVRLRNWICPAASLARGRLGDVGIYCAPSPASASASLVRQSACLRIRVKSDSDSSSAAVRNSASAIGRVKKIVQ